MFSISKSIQTEIAAIDKLVNSLERDFQKTFADFLKTVKSTASLKIMRQYLENSDINGLVKYVNSLNKPLGAAVANAIIASANHETAILEPKVQRFSNKQNPLKPKITLAFNPGDERAAQIIRNATTSLIVQISEQQRLSIFDSISTGLQAGDGPRKMAREISEVVGLTQKQNQAVKNYRQLLEDGNAEALQRGLRDKRRDGTIRRSIKDQDPLSSKQINSMAEAYRAKYIRYRSEVIARDQIGSAVAVGRDEALRQTNEDVGISAEETFGTWNTTKDGRQRDTHNSMSGQVRNINDTFDSPSGAKLRYPKDPLAPASEKIQCRCIRTISYRGLGESRI